eukprot:CAMPEP_0183716386 /NCGR_PEP_ID=MMETSP0737-20130205/10330_1 /TAXON_ID=385413 /ORGANISM="Thalassiosira miniscula, Strain CCMP1093" /LENGTH=59 /DNA_ID=CAMNT_0025945653 /DNA_START=160 /DNA_END=339 /DNA_ORIENTATION=-
MTIDNDEDELGEWEQKFDVTVALGTSSSLVLKSYHTSRSLVPLPLRSILYHAMMRQNHR